MARLKRILLSSAIVVVTALILWGGILSPARGTTLHPGSPPFAPFLFAAPLAVGVIAYESLLHSWLTREGASPPAWLWWTILVPIGLVAASLALAGPRLPALVRLLSP